MVMTKQVNSAHSRKLLSDVIISTCVFTSTYNRDYYYVTFCIVAVKKVLC